MLNFHDIIDISLPIYEGMPIYPDNTAVAFAPEKGATTARTVITLGSHTGTHIDAPLHVIDGARAIDKIVLSAFMGECRVLDFTHIDFGGAVEIRDLEAQKIIKGERILLKTRNSLRGFTQFYYDYVYLGGDTAEYMAERKVTLVGIDSLSIKQKGSSDLRAHEALLKENIPILEGLDLSKTSQGRYMLFALPLKFMGIDGSPCRAVLTDINQQEQSR
jgi:arylformamidase